MIEPDSWERVGQEAAELLSRYLQIDTTNPPGNETAGALFLRDIFTREGVECSVLEPKPGRGSMVTRYCGDQGRPEILLLHHIDVVPAEKAAWKHPPFSGAAVGEEIWGRGAVDCKSLGIVELMAFLLLKRRGCNPEKHFVYAATADEEAGGRWGVRWLLDAHPEKITPYSVINEGVGLGFDTAGTGLYLCQVAEKGACWVRISFEGQPGHGSLPRDDNCVVSMARAIAALARHRFPYHVTGPVKAFIEALAPEQNHMEHDEFLELLDEKRSGEILDRIQDTSFRGMLAATLQNSAVPTVAVAGSKNNVIPGRSYCEVDCRILPHSTPDECLSDIRAVLASAGCSNFSVSLQAGSGASASPVETPLYEALTEGYTSVDPTARVIPYLSPGATDSRFFRSLDIPAYGVQFESSCESACMVHGHNERIRTHCLVTGIQVLYSVLSRYCR